MNKLCFSSKSKVMFVVASVSYFAIDRQRRCPDETIFVTAVVFMATYRIGAEIGFNVNYVSDIIELIFNELLYGIPDRVGTFVVPLRTEIERQYNRIYNKFYPPPHSTSRSNPPRQGRSAHFAR